jgi:two-component sensor histidine kinase
MKPGLPFILLFFVAVGLTAAIPSLAQPGGAQPSFESTVAKQRLQLKLTTSFVYFAMQGQLDIDSAAIMVSEGEHLPYSLYFDEDYAAGPDSKIKELLKKGSAYLFRSGTAKHDLDSALPLLLAAQQEADRIKDAYFQQAALGVLGKYYLQDRDVTKSKGYFTEAVELAKKANDPKVLFRSLANRGSNEGFNDPQKEADLNQALGLARQLGDTIGEIEMLTRIYEIHFVHQKYDTVKKQLLYITGLERRIGFRHIHYNYYVLSYLDYTAGNYAGVFENAKTSIDIMEANHDLVFSNFFYGNMANIYARFNNYEKSLYWLNKSLQQEPVNKAKRVWYHQFTNTSINIAKFGHPQEALDFGLETISNYPPVTADQEFHVAHFLAITYNLLNQRSLAARYFDMMLPLMDSIPHTPEENDKLFTAYLDLADFNMDLGRTDLSRKYYQKGIVYSDPQKLFNISKANAMLSRIDSSEGNYQKALREFKLSNAASDSIYSLRRKNQFAELQTQYETEVKDKNIELLVEKDKVQQANLHQSDIVRRITLSGILVLLIVIGLIYGQYRIKRRANKAINEKNRALEQLVRDKEWLVKEIHHRVKNNFHIVSSLLEIQSSYLKNRDALSAIQESQHRIHAMSIIHQKLYQSDTLSTIHMPEYIYELVEYLRESYAIRENIGFALQIENIELNDASAITLGLILNEAITNAIKYAFTKTKNGQIAISLTHISDSQILLSIADNGRGLPTDFETKIGASMGMELLQGLTDDLGGSFSIETNNGTQIKVIFGYKRINVANVPFSQ